MPRVAEIARFTNATPHLERSLRACGAYVEKPIRRWVVRVTIEFFTPLLAAEPSHHPAVQWVRGKQIEQLARELRKSEGLSAAEAEARARALVDETLGALPSTDEELLHPTVFYRHPETGQVVLAGYHWKGYFKEKIPILLLTRAARTKRLEEVRVRADDVSKELTIDEEWIPLLRPDGSPVAAPDKLYGRILRRRDPRGFESTTPAVSEIVFPPCQATFTVTGVEGGAVTVSHIAEALVDGVFQGVGQWRTGGHGRFAVVSFERLDGGSEETA